MHNLLLALTIVMAWAVFVGLLLVLLYAGMRALKLWTPRLRRSYWRSVGAAYLVLAMTMLIGFTGIFGTGCGEVGNALSYLLGAPLDPSVPKCR